MKTAFWIVLNLSLGVLILAFCLYISDAGQNSVSAILSKQLLLSPENEALFENWKNPKYDTIYNFYLFHIDNPEEVISTGAKPKLVEKGPFCHRNHNFKTNITFHEKTVEFVSHTQYFEHDWPGKKCQDLNTKVTQFNTPFAIVMGMLDNPKYKQYAGMLMMMAPKSWGLFTTKTAKEHIWGYEDPVFKTLVSFKMLKSPMFGHFAGMNESDSKVYEIGTGIDNIRNVGRIYKWNNMTSLTENKPDPIWNSDYANQIAGTDGGAFAPLLNKNDRVFVFLDSMCRSLDFVSAEEITMLNNVATWEYTLSLEALDSATKQNHGFCVGNPRKCSPSGSLSIQTCLKASMGFSLPLVMSKPHFLHGDDSLKMHFDGLSPKPEHQTSLYAEPNTGTVLKAEKNLQTNIEFNAFGIEKALKEDALKTSSLKNGFIAPLYYVNQAFDPNDELLTYFDENITGPLQLLQKWPLGLLAIGILGNFIAFVMGLIIHHREGKEAKISTSDKAQKERFISMT